MLSEKSLEQQSIFSGRVFDVEVHTVELQDQSKARRELIRHRGGVGILPIDEAGHVYLVRQYRKAVEQVLLEIPAGKLELGEAPKTCAMRELKEETGFVSEELDLLGTFYPTPAYCDECIYLYLATRLVAGEAQLDPGEFLECVKLPFDQVHRMVLSGELTDGKTQLAILKAAELMRRQHGAQTAR